MKQYVIIVAGGKGIRFNSAVSTPTSVPKQFLMLNDLPVLMHTVKRFHDYLTQCNEAGDIILVLPQDQIEYWQQLCAKHCFTIPHQIVTGGETRSKSVVNGLNKVPDNTLVAIHDGVRPLITIDLISRCFKQAGLTGSAIPTMPATDTLRHITGKLIDRNTILTVQTPQVFDSDKLKQAYNSQFSIFNFQFSTFTDDASVYEAAGNKLTFIEGETSNIKITRPFDLMLAKLWLSNIKENEL